MMIISAIKIYLKKRIHGKYSYKFTKYFDRKISEKPNLLKLVGHMKTRSCLDNEIFEHLAVITKNDSTGQRVNINSNSGGLLTADQKSILKSEGQPFCCQYKKHNEHFFKTIGYYKNGSMLRYKQFYFFLDKEVIMLEKEVTIRKIDDKNDLLNKMIGSNLALNKLDNNKHIFVSNQDILVKIIDDGFKLHVCYFKTEYSDDSMKIIKDMIDQYSKPNLKLNNYKCG